MNSNDTTSIPTAINNTNDNTAVAHINNDIKYEDKLKQLSINHTN